MIEQGTAEWFELRRGNASGSRISDVIAKTKSGASASRENYLTELVLERLGINKEPFTSVEMQHGTDTEPFARAEYEIKNQVFVEEVGYILHPNIENSGASPDGKVNDGLLEIKCPSSKTHFQYLLDEKLPSKYKPQVFWQMACTGAKWVDFVSYDPRVPNGLQYFEIRVMRDEEYIKELEKEVTQFLIEVESKFQQLKLRIKS